tara:strand:- start:275 stop:451 length:177 start_codon:yes stop_codon:yes gene_type:complete
MELCVGVRQVVVATGLYLQELINFGFNFGVQVVTGQVLVHVTDAITGKLLVVDITTVK